MRISSKKKIIGDNYRFTLLTPHLIRMEYSEGGHFIDNQTQVVMNRDFPEFEFDYIESDDLLEIYTDFFHLTYNKRSFSSQGLTIDMKSNYTDFNNKWSFGDNINTLKGTTRTLDNINGATELGEGIISREGYSVLDDSSSFTMTVNGEPKAKLGKNTDIYFFGYQHEYKLALKDFFRLTGSTPIIPRFALGNWWSRFWAYTENSYLELMDKFHQEGVPLSVSVIDMDWHLREIPKRFGSSWTGYTWNKELFPNPQSFLNQLHERGLKVTLNVHPADGIRAFEDCYTKVAARLKLNVLLEEKANFDMTDNCFVESYFKDVHHPLEDQGVDFWWIDWQQGDQSKEDGLDPLWLLNQYHFEDIQKRKDGLILSRYAGPGSHRYPIGFSGDSIISWESLQFQPYFTSTASNIGYTWWSHDIGGHMGGKRDDELTLRWMQFGTFSPINRLHSSSSPFNSKEPWNFSSEIQNAMKESLRERHRLLPYLYTANVSLNELGEALIEPLYYEFPDDEEAYDYKNQYMFGNQLMVVPIVHKTDDTYKFAKEKTWLPSGKWYDFYSGNRYEGDTEISIFRKKNELGVFAKAGSIIPTDGNIMDTLPNELPKQIHWKIFPGANNHYELVEDIHDLRCITKLTLDWKHKIITIETAGDKSILPVEREHTISLYCVESEDGTPFEENIFSAKVEERLELEVREIEHQNVCEMVFERINLPDISYDFKNKLWNKLSQNMDFIKKINIIKSFNDDWLAEMLYELFYIEES